MRYGKLVELYEKLESTSKRLEKTFHISEFLKKTSVDDIPTVVLLMQGKVFPDYDERKIGVASRLVLKAINVATGINSANIENNWKKTGDLGETAAHYCGKKTQATLTSTELTIKKVFQNLRKLAELEGAGTVDKKVKLVSELLTSAKPREAKYIVRTVLEELRVGVASGTLRDAIVWAFFEKEIKVNYDKETGKVDPENREEYKKYLDAVQGAYDVSNDFGDVAIAAKNQKLEGVTKVKMAVGKPIKVMLYPKAENIKEAFDTVGKPAALEYKYDGFRIQVHKTGGTIKLFTRRLEEVTKQFPDVVKFVKSNIKGDDFILDSEAVGFDGKTGKYVAFQKMSQRIKRKYNIEQMMKDFPVELNIFDIMCYKGENIMNKPFKERRKFLEKMVKQEKKKIVLAKQIVTSNEEKADKFYRASLASGEEGIMAKNLEGIYKPGSRVGYGIKVKPVMETLDLVIVGAEWGEGKRKGWLSSFVVACRDGKDFIQIGKVGTGIKELESDGVTFDELTKMLKPLIVEDKGKTVIVKPKIIIELNYEEIQKSPTYSSGFALRFPRVVRLRPDKPLSEVSSIRLVKKLYITQRSR